MLKHFLIQSLYLLSFNQFCRNILEIDKNYNFGSAYLSLKDPIKNRHMKIKYNSLHKGQCSILGVCRHSP